MARRFKQLDLEARCEIARRREAGESLREIAAGLDCSASTISRELKRNSAASSYKPVYAQEKTRSRRWIGSRLERIPGLQKRVLGMLRRGVSPEQVGGALAREAGHQVISYESIYRFIYAQIRRTKNYAWRKYLPREKAKRGNRGTRGGSPALHIKNRVSIHERPASVLLRDDVGNWEADLISFSRYDQHLLALHERASRLVLLTPIPSKAAAGTADRIISLLEWLPPDVRLSVTFDNGTEFAEHSRLVEALGLSTYFCDPHAPWQKGGIENAIGRLRRALPRKTDLDTISTARLAQLVSLYNYVPRKCLGYRTPAEVFAQALHFKCESSSPRSRGRRGRGAPCLLRLARARCLRPQTARGG